jgi:phosphoribosyl 1,2-cyclic phosphate phosphodiesterase
LLRWAGRNVLIDTSTDFRQQGLREGLDRVDAVLFTHTHADHIHGIDDLRTLTPAEGDAIPVYGSQQTAQKIERVFSYIFHDVEEPGYRPRLRISAIAAPFELFGRIVTPVPLVHGPGESYGYRIGPLAYLTDCSEVPGDSLSLLQGLEVLVVDALRFREHASHFNLEGAIELARKLGVPRTLLTHLSHDIDYEAHGAELPGGVEFAYDGLILTLPFGD